MYGLNIFDRIRDYLERVRIRRLKKRHPVANKPEYDRKMGVWVVRVDNRFEFGSCDYVISEYCKSGLYYPYNDKYTTNESYNNHAHSFDEVLMAVLQSPNTFTIDGFEEYYSKQEMELIETLRCKVKGEI